MVVTGGTVAVLSHGPEKVRGEEHGAPLGDERAHELAELEDAGGVEAVGRLVEDQ
jgi:hypothetical protein